MKNTLAFLGALTLVLICSINGCGDNTHQMSECMPGTVKVISDCADANSVMCSCERADASIIHPNGSVDPDKDYHIVCDSQCAPYDARD